MSYYLLDHRQGSRTWYTSRGTTKAIVVHVTAGLEDQDATNDNSAEAVCRYAATTDRSVSWHSSSDTDSVIRLLPDTYTAWHCRGYNSKTYGHEISKRTANWDAMSERWVQRSLIQAADALRPVADKYNVPLRHVSKHALDEAISSGGRPVGFVGHHQLDPTRRTDPGLIGSKDTFPWERLFDYIRGGAPPSAPTLYQEVDVAGWPVIGRGDEGVHVKMWQRLCELEDDGDFGPATEAATKAFQVSKSLKADGVVGAKTLSAKLRLK